MRTGWPLKAAAMFLLVSGWIIAARAVAWLEHAPRVIFLASGVAIQVVGLSLLARAHRGSPH